MCLILCILLSTKKYTYVWQLETYKHRVAQIYCFLLCPVLYLKVLDVICHYLHIKQDKPQLSII